MTNIFLLEDDPIIGKAVQMQLELESFRVHWCLNLKEAQKDREMLKGMDLFLLDINLPDGSGIDFCQWVRQDGMLTPIVFMTARSDEDSLVRGFETGGNDYIRKPFGNAELMVRIRNQLSEKKPVLNIVRYADVALIKNQQILKKEDQIISLNRREFEILEVFFDQPEIVITREQLIRNLSAGEEIFDRTVDSHISHIRTKLQKNGLTNLKINSVYGQGYRMEKKSDH